MMVCGESRKRKNKRVKGNEEVDLIAIQQLMTNITKENIEGKKIWELPSIATV